MERLKQVGRIDLLVVVDLALVAGVSLVAIYSTASDLVGRQLLFWVIGAAVFFLLSQVDWEVLKVLSGFFFWGGVAGLLVTLIFGLTVRGSARWLSLAGVNLQPSELIKPILILAWARELTDQMGTREWLKWVVKVGLVVGLVLAQPDLGSGIVVVLLAVMMAVVAGMRARVLGGLVLLGAMLLPLTWGYLASYQQARIVNFFNPGLDPQGGGYHSLQAKIAIGSGGLWGKGLKGGTQVQLSFLPERHTDFIFSALGEEFGLVGAVGLLLLLGFLLWRVLRWAESEEGERQVLMAGVFGYIFVQMAINILMNLGWLPITGITLPLVSYGGSSLISVMAALGLAQAARKM